MEKADEWMSFISNRGCPDKLLSFRLDYTLFQVWIIHLFVTYGRRWHPPVIVPRHHNRIVRQDEELFHYGMAQHPPRSSGKIGSPNGLHKEGISRENISL